MRLGSLRLHLRTLAKPSISFDTMLAAMQDVYMTARIQIRLVSAERLDLPEFEHLRVGDCKSDCTDEQARLYAYRGSALATDVVVFICESLIPPIDGCATHPPGQPSVALQHAVDRWALAHEVGHLLGLVHVCDDDRLMTGNGTENITNAPPDLSQDEIKIMRASPLVSIPSGASGEVRALLESHDLFQEKVARLPRSGQRELAAIARSDEIALASKAVYLASLLREDRGAPIVERALQHPATPVRIAAAAAASNLGPGEAARIRRRALAHQDESVRRVAQSLRISGRASQSRRRRGTR